MYLSITTADFFLGALSSFVASIAFICTLLFFYRPKLKISPNIARQSNTFESTPNLMYVFKFYNASVFDAFDADLLLYKVEKYNNAEGKSNDRLIGLKLKLPSLKQIPRFRFLTKKSASAPHCLLFRSIEDIDAVFNNNQEIELQITLKHGATGLSRVFKQRYKKSQIKDGEFKFGNTFEIIS